METASQQSCSNISGIILAGGLSSRFNEGYDEPLHKALIKLGDKKMIQHIIDEMSEIIDEILIVVLDTKMYKLFQHLETPENTSLPVRIVKDDLALRAVGPLRGVLSGLKTAKHSKCLVSPCDTLLSSKLMITLIHGLESQKNAAIATVGYPNGTIEPLLLAMDTRIASKNLEVLGNLPRGRPSDLFRICETSVICQLKRPLPNINRRNQLQRLTREQFEVEIDTQANECKKMVSSAAMFKDFIRFADRGEDKEAQNALHKEITHWRDQQCSTLEFHAIGDAMRLKSVTDDIRAQFEFRLRELRTAIVSVDK